MTHLWLIYYSTMAEVWVKHGFAKYGRKRRGIARNEE
jgi:hypothetical protein